MDGCSSKRGVAMSRAPRNGYNIGSRDAKSAQDQNVQFCNRIGCNGRIKYGNQNMKTGSSEKAKSSDSSFCPLKRNGVIETSSRNGSVIAREKSSYLDSKRKSSSQLRFDQLESSQVPIMKTGSGPSSLAPRRKIQYTTGSNKLNPQTSAVSSTFKSSGLGALNSNNRSKCLKNLKCNSISDATPPSCSSSISKSPSKNVINKRSLETTATFGENVSSSSGGASTSDHRHNSCTSGADRTVRLSHQQNRRNTSCYRDSELPRNVGISRLLQHHSANASTSNSSSYSLFSSNDDSQSTLMPYSSAEHGYISHLVDFDTLQQYNMDGIAEVFLTLERIEQEEEMTNEQILALESSLYLSGLILYDQHRDMRLDIDDMSYEDLLALGDRIGTVSTALSEEELLRCVNRSIYQVTPPEVGFTESSEDGDDVKCSICQEDYINGDEMGELVECEHAYHVGCIYQWLRLKNWCPICKTLATPSSSS